MPNIVPLDMPAAYWRDKAKHASRAGDYPEAVRLFRAALRKHDDNATRRELAATYADMHSFLAADRLYMENLARDPADVDSVYGLARSRSLAGDERAMAEILDTYLRAAPCGEQADHARDILWRLPKAEKEPPRMHRAQVLCAQAADHQNEPRRAFEMAKLSWKRGKTPECAQLLCELYLHAHKPRRALQYAYIACNMQPQDLNSRLQLAQALRVANMPQASRAALKQAMPLCKTHDQAPAFCRMAMTLDFPDLAEEMMEQRLREWPCSVEYLLLLALALYAQGNDQEREKSVLRRAEMLDEDDHMARALLEMPWHDGPQDPRQMMKQSIRFMENMAEMAGGDEEDPQHLHRQLVAMLRLPMPGMTEMAVHLMMQTHDAVGLRLALLEGSLPPVLYALILDELKEMGEPLPCYARPDGRLCLVPPRRRPPYDADLHDLVRELLHRNHGSAALDVVARQIPQLWRRLPESARRHYAQCRDGVWLTAFSAYLMLEAGDPMAADKVLCQAYHPKRVRRAYQQLIRRSSSIHEVY